VFINVEARSQEAKVGTEKQHDADEHEGLSIDTRAVHAGYSPSEFVVKGSVAPPLYMSNTYEKSCQNVSLDF
jgi:hypothetical protein